MKNIKNLVIVESGAKAKTISKYLNTNDLTNKFGKFHVIASNGHIRDLIKDNMGFDNKTFKASYEIIPSKDKVIKTLKNEIKSSDVIWLAADQDREGEAIAWHIKDHFKLKKYKRITFNEITPNALHYAVNNHRDINYDLVDAQQCRRILDRLVGFKLTKVLWKSFNTSTTLSAGRVQSVVLRMIIEKENTIKNFTSTPYWKINGSFKLDNFEIETDLYHKDTIFKLMKESHILTFFKSLSPKFLLDKDKTKIHKIKTRPDIPFITSTLQQSAHNIGFSLAKTMKIAQELYEAGHITYMRTDSVNISQDAMKKIKQYVDNKYGDELFFDHNSNTKNKSKNSQEAHEAIRPTTFDKKDLKLSIDQKKLYELIFKRTVASQMKHAEYEELLVNIKNDKLDNSYRFIGKIKVLVYEGYLLVFDEKAQKSIQNKKEQILNSKDLKLKSLIAKNVHSVPPQRYNESTIINQWKN